MFSFLQQFVFSLGAKAARKESSTGPDPNETIQQAWTTARKGIAVMDWMGAPTYVGKTTSFQAAQHHAAKAIQFKGKSDLKLEATFMEGQWDLASEKFIDNQIARAAQPGTRKAERRLSSSSMPSCMLPTEPLLGIPRNKKRKH